jgi:hypothetical protein
VSQERILKEAKRVRALKPSHPSYQTKSPPAKIYEKRNVNASNANMYASLHMITFSYSITKDGFRYRRELMSSGIWQCCICPIIPIRMDDYRSNIDMGPH